MSNNTNLWPSITVLVSALAIVISLTILQGQTHGRIDAVRSEVLTEVRALRSEMREEFQSLRAPPAVAEYASIAFPD